MATKNKNDERILVEPDNVVFVVDNRPLTPDEEKLLHDSIQESKREYLAKLKSGKIKIPSYLKKIEYEKKVRQKS
jgi:hypothetical protein